MKNKCASFNLNQWKHLWKNIFIDTFTQASLVTQTHNWNQIVC